MRTGSQPTSKRPIGLKAEVVVAKKPATRPGPVVCPGRGKKEEKGAARGAVSHPPHQVPECVPHFIKDEQGLRAVILSAVCSENLVSPSEIPTASRRGAATCLGPRENCLTMVI